MKSLIYSLEDDKEISHIIQVTLIKAGYDVECFNDYKSFKEEFDKKKPKLILLDMMLPDSDGLTIIKEIRKDEENKRRCRYLKCHC